MERRVMVFGFVMIVAGLALLVYADPALNAVVIGQTTTKTTTTTTSSGVTGFPGGSSVGSFVTSGSGSTGATISPRSSSSSSLSTDSIAENSAGLGLALVGLVFVAADSRLRKS